MTLSFSHYLLEGYIEFHENIVPVMVIEDPKTFGNFISELSTQINGGEGKAILAEDLKVLAFSKEVEIITDPILADINSHKITNKLLTVLREKAMESENFIATQEIKSQISKYAEQIVFSSDLPICYDDEIEISSLFKGLSIKISNDGLCLAEKMIEYVRILQMLLGIKLVIFANLKCYLNEDDLGRFYQLVGYLKINVILLENIVRGKIDGEEMYIIDRDLCRIC